MANLIIKPSASGSLILQDEGGDAAITVGTTGNTTLSGTANALGTASGILTLNDGSVLNHDAQKNAWQLAIAGDIQITSTSYIDFGAAIFVGSNVTESAGGITIGDSGLYQISCQLSNFGSDAGSFSTNLYINNAGGGNTQVNGTRLYRGGSHAGFTYVGESGSWIVRLTAGDVVWIRGTGYFHGSSTDSMCSYSGCRIGAKT